MVLKHVRTSDNDSHEIASLLAQVSDEVKGDTMLNYVNMVSQRIYTDEKILRMPFGGCEDGDDCQWRWEEVGFPYDLAQPLTDWWDAGNQASNIPDSVMATFEK